MAYPPFISPGITDVGEEARARGWSGEGIWGFLAFPCLCLGSEAREGPRRGLLPLLKIFFGLLRNQYIVLTRLFIEISPPKGTMWPCLCSTSPVFGLRARTRVCIVV